MAGHRSAVPGCSFVFSVCAVISGVALMQISYWWDDRHPTEWMSPRWDTIFLAILPWLGGAVSIGAGTFAGLVALCLWLIRLIRKADEA